ncbi:putative ATP-dependent RNA helicase [Paragonimus heterotremus]|uniref:Putative ATP-dependent RNA helicase n=1 Tax=Paragonimus heterotremus TaxID=100268 RepID=A0A8J4T592_9TREM|nr:putative ATP-dependent RNA helicase [Paragonimus heterotremus]
MPTAVMKKPRHIYALQVTRQLVDNPARLSDYVSASGAQVTEQELNFLRKFLSNNYLKRSFELIDELTAGSNFIPLVRDLRPASPTERDSLQALSDLWTELEAFVMQTREDDEPEAHELYDLLADRYIREVLVAYDDIANHRYHMEELDLIEIYTEPEPLRKSLSTERVSSKHEKISRSRDLLVQPEELIDDSLVEVTAISEDPNRRVSASNSDFVVVNLPPDQDLNESDDGSPKYRSRAAQKPTATGGTVDRPGINVAKLASRFESQTTTPVPSRASDKSSLKTHRSSTPKESKFKQSLAEEDSWDSIPVGDSRMAPDTKVSSLPVNSPHPKLISAPTGLPASPITPRNSRNSRVHDVSNTSETNRRNSQNKPDSEVSPVASTAKNLVSGPGSASSRVPKKRTAKQTDNPALPSHPSTLPVRNNKRQSKASKEITDDLPLATQSLHRRTSRQSTTSDGTRKQPEPGKPRLVRLRRDRPGEAIGITIAVRTPSPTPTNEASAPSGMSCLAIQRVMTGSVADRNGSLLPGDILLEFNGRPVHSLDEVYKLMQQTSSALECELLVKTPTSGGILRPGSQHKPNSLIGKRYIRTFFDYDATKDALMPTGDCGLSFKSGDVLELVDDQDPNWWQVRPLNDAHSKTRLVPSQTLEERRKAFNQEKTPGSGTRKSKRTIKTFFRAADASGLRLRADLWSYEEVVPWPQSMIPCLLLLGSTGVGRRNLKVLLASHDPQRFAYPTSDTTNPTASANQFTIVPKAQMEADVRSGAYVEWGKVDGHYYGIRFSAIRKIIASGRTAVLDCQPQTVHLLHQPEFNPCVVLVGAPAFEVAKRMMEEGLQAGVTKNNRSDVELRNLIEESHKFAKEHRHLYFHTLTNGNLQESVEKLNRLVSRLERQPSWIPSGWAYELSVPTGSGLPGTGTTFIPGSSSLSALGLPGLPPARASTIARSVISGISEASAESAYRLARPPSICSSTGANERGRGKPPVPSGQRLYERRRKPQYDFRPLSPAIPEHDTPSESGVSHSVLSSHNRTGTPSSKAYRQTPSSGHSREKHSTRPGEKADRENMSPRSHDQSGLRTSPAATGSNSGRSQPVALRPSGKENEVRTSQPAKAPHPTTTEDHPDSISDTSTEADDTDEEDHRN